MPARLRPILCGKHATRVGPQTERPDLRTVRIGIECEAFRYGQAGVTEARKIRGLGPEAVGIGRLRGAKRNDEWRHSETPRR
jgi:hypothetical protein